MNVTEKFALTRAGRGQGAGNGADLSAILPSWIGGYYGTANYTPLYNGIMGTTYSCLKLVANNVSKLKWFAVKGVAQGKEEMLPWDHWLVRLLANPNPFIPRHQIWDMLIQWLKVTGEAFVFIQRENGAEDGLPIALWVLDSDKFLIEGDKIEFVKSYMYMNGGRPYTFRGTDIIHFRNFVPTSNQFNNLYRGVSELSRVQDLINAEMFLLQFQQAEFVNGMQLRFVIEQQASGGIPNPGMEEKQQQIYWSRWREKYSGAKNAGMSAILPPGMTLHEMQGRKEMDYEGTMATYRKRIAEAFGVPLNLLSGDYEGYKNGQAGLWQFLSQTIDPLASYIAECFTTAFLYDEENIKVIHAGVEFEDADTKVAKFNAAKGYGATVNDAKRLLGEPEVPNGNDPIMPMTVTTITNILAGTNLTPTPAPAAAESSSLVSPKSAAQKSMEDEEEDLGAIWKKKDDAVAPYRARLQKVIAATYKKLGDELVAKVRKAKAYQKDGDDVDVAKLRKAVDIDVDEWKAELEATYPTLGLLISDAIDRALYEVDWDEVLSDKDALVRKIMQKSVDMITETPQTVKDEIGDIVTKGLSNGNTVDAIADKIHSHFEDVITKSRAQTIAQTTTTASVTDSNLETWKKIGITKTRWLTAGPGEHRESHIAMNGVRSDAHGDGKYHVPSYKVGNGKSVAADVMVGPGKGKVAGQNIRCGCSLMAAPRHERMPKE